MAATIIEVKRIAGGSYWNLNCCFFPFFNAFFSAALILQKRLLHCLLLILPLLPLAIQCSSPSSLVMVMGPPSDDLSF
ncbi:hypothetical protein CK203_075850 [Vitis vinifera]|uniref:Uncharacterized protein n=1 Tax=Vitis vinifera TaxID=29760 RepID=A0A438EF72_VITVI|nr:hypothetical protein CK203_075850 [Vitis vinifera]